MKGVIQKLSTHQMEVEINNVTLMTMMPMILITIQMKMKKQMKTIMTTSCHSKTKLRLEQKSAFNTSLVCARSRQNARFGSNEYQTIFFTALVKF